DESTTIDLDSLDIELEETEGIVSHGLDEAPDFEIDEIRDDEGAGGDEDMDTTIDLDSLDITLEEEEELKRGIELDDEERLNLGDAGLSLDQLADEEPAGESRDETGLAAIEEEEEDIKLSIEEIDPGLSVDDLAGSVTIEEHLITEDFGTERLPEIDIEGLSDADVAVYRPPVEDDEERLTGLVDEKPIGAGPDDYLDIESREEFARYQSELEGEERGLGDVVPGGSVNFSVDYSLGYSRPGALLRLIMVYAIGLLPRLVVALVYSLVSWVASVFNWLLILLTGESQEDYSEMQEKTLRAVVSLAACASGIVEEMPSFTGRKNIDYPLQLNIIYPVRYSRVFAFLRISIVGMVLIMLPHLLLLTLLTLGALLIYIAGMISVLAVRKWPTILFDFMSRYYGYLSGVLAFMVGLVDRYPSFRFD
ncbi:MAG TPA: DUF4389 domain-containing protein, partial [Spirochaetes bacterium]|nr:DUF4389 domain-containing protein [Spirochaetota bacterium]